MNNFSDLLVIDRQLQITITVNAIYDNGMPTVIIRANGQTINNKPLRDRHTFTLTADLLAPLCLEIEMQGKVYDEKYETAVIIEQIQIDDFNVVPDYTQHARYDNERNFNQPTNYLGFNGIWTLSFDKPFYQWMHQISGEGWLLNPI